MLLRVFHRCLDEAGIKRVRFHDLRHSFASLLIQKGANPKYIQEQLGHSSIKVTMDVYGHLFEGDHRHVINLLDDAQEQAESATPPQPTLEVLKPFAYKQLENITKKMRRGGRAAEGSGLLNRRRVYMEWTQLKN